MTPESWTNLAYFTYNATFNYLVYIHVCVWILTWIKLEENVGRLNLM
jgi:hypothetical protein